MSGTEPTTSELAEALRELSDTVSSLRDDVRRGTRTLPPPEEPSAPEHAWLSVLEAPTHRRPAVPRIVLEALFLAACATAVVIADLDPLVIAAVMAGAWVLVALVELTAARADRYREALLLAAPPRAVAAEPLPPASDPAWYSPPVEQTMLDASEVGATAITRLPPPADEHDATV